jgi:hypothetical protein
LTREKERKFYHVLPQFLSPYKKGICCVAGANVRLVDFLRISKRVKEFLRFSFEFIALLFIPDDDIGYLNDVIGELV